MERARMAQQEPEDWLSFYIYYHEDRDRLLLGLVRPLVAALLNNYQIDNFFFVRYALGGPHIRLRVRSCSTEHEKAATTVLIWSKQFLGSCPSSRSLPFDVLRKEMVILTSENPAEEDRTIYPDNSVRQVPCRFEVERYGGAMLLESSLDFFAISSVKALEAVQASGPNHHRRLGLAFQILLGFALGFARDVGELVDLVRGFPPAHWMRASRSIEAQSKKTYEAQRGTFRALLEQTLAMPLSWNNARGAAGCLAQEIETAPVGRSRILTSQLHMTANRIGLSNLEEVYLSKLLLLSLLDAEDALSVAWGTPVAPPSPATGSQLTACTRQTLRQAFEVSQS